MAEEEQPKSEQKPDGLFEHLSEIKPVRTDIPSLEGGGLDSFDELSGSLSKRMKESPKMSDMQTADKRLFPILKEAVTWLNDLMVARVSPETYLPLRNIIVKHLLKEFPELAVAEAIVISETAISIALDGEGRIDELALFGRSSEMGEEEKKNKLLG